jgi:hypothetical protein
MAKGAREPKRVMLTLRPGNRGTKGYVAQYGDQLVCVRYRYDAVKRQRHTTVELIVESSQWYPPHEPDELVLVHITAHEKGLQQSLRLAGGFWDSEHVAWRVRYHIVVNLGLIDRIIEHR